MRIRKCQPKFSLRYFINLLSVKPRSASKTTGTQWHDSCGLPHSLNRPQPHRTGLSNHSPGNRIVRPRYTTPTQTMQKQSHTIVVSRPDRGALCPTGTKSEPSAFDAATQSADSIAIVETGVGGTEQVARLTTCTRIHSDERFGSEECQSSSSTRSGGV